MWQTLQQTRTGEVKTWGKQEDRKKRMGWETSWGGGEVDNCHTWPTLGTSWDDLGCLENSLSVNVWPVDEEGDEFLYKGIVSSMLYKSTP
ncbi:uncharacterized protein SPSK_02087 [Sporothrix schenckii 1099-18]|uniref:Uncharacterized protein n=1 Tax=Sporothrix schenckii 1099-18 TaxID=1397361 RepID=A0A0F2MDS4_SPOSC|nr:uncharacterized protein SPSK_02087 [Sporothrix schenckii 1099-18]KJR87239.1 hypothetical protein SPSK_02087 [Sporothrix schenckii 1099-18]